MFDLCILRVRSNEKQEGVDRLTIELENMGIPGISRDLAKAYERLTFASLLLRYREWAELVEALLKVIRQGSAHLLGLLSVIVAALIRPGPVVRWLSRHFPDVLFERAKAGPLVALSFDDSPHVTSTPRILDVLAEHDAHATFFIIGEHVAGNEAIVRRLVDEGHELGNHMMSDAPSARLPAAEFERELLQTHELLARFGPVRWFRPGHTWFNRPMLDQIDRHGYRCAMASAYALEFLPVPAPYAARHILLNVRPGAVIILHDGVPGLERTVGVLQRVLPVLRRRGYRLVTVSELAAAGQSPDVD